MRKAGVLPILFVTAALLACLGWIKWNSRSSDAHLAWELEQDIQKFIGQIFADSDLEGLKVRNLKVKRGKEYIEFSGEVVVTRRRFATGDGAASPSSLDYFEASGTGVYPLHGLASTSQEHVAVARWLGPVRTVWSSIWWHCSGPFGKVEGGDEMDLIAEGGANMLYDLHFYTLRYERRAPLWHRRDLRDLSVAALRREGRLEEAAELWAMRYDALLTGIIHDWEAEKREAVTLLRILEADPAKYRAEIAKMKRVLRAPE